MVYSEIMVPGRVARGESFEYDICYMKALAKNQKEIIRCIDIAILEPKKRNSNTLGILGTFSVCWKRVYTYDVKICGRIK